MYNTYITDPISRKTFHQQSLYAQSYFDPVRGYCDHAHPTDVGAHGTYRSLVSKIHFHMVLCGFVLGVFSVVAIGAAVSMNIALLSAGFKIFIGKFFFSPHVILLSYLGASVFLASLVPILWSALKLDHYNDALNSLRKQKWILIKHTF